MKTAFLVLLIASWAPATSWSAPIAFPNSTRTSEDPTGRFTIQWEEPSTDDGLHTLYLQARDSTNRTKLFSFARHVEVLWSPHGTRLAITDWSSSDTADLWVFDPAVPEKPICARDQLPADIRHETRSAHHLYFQAKQWQSDDRLEFIMEGNGSEPDGSGSFHKQLTLDLKTQQVAQ